MKVVTVVVENQTGHCPNNNKRFSFIKNNIKENESTDIILFPACYFYFNHQRAFRINRLCNKISAFIETTGFLGTVCVGIDCDGGNDQLAVAINSGGIQAMGRKFHPTADENGCIRQAKNYNDLE